MSRKGPRGLTPEEHELWSKVTERATPMRPARAQTMPEILQSPKPVKPRNEPIPSFDIGEQHSETYLSHNLSPSLSQALSQQPIQMDRKGYTNLKRGKMRPEARLDLHGVTLARAHPMLNQSILESHAKSRRLVLVITGKGKDRDDGGPIPVRRGVLKHQVPHWLHTAPLSHVILQISEAHLKHGGTGAYYVYLRRKR